MLSDKEWVLLSFTYKSLHSILFSLYSQILTRPTSIPWAADSVILNKPSVQKSPSFNLDFDNLIRMLF